MATIFGTNFDGCSDTAGDPVLHPQLPKALKSLNMKYVRFWTEGSFTSSFPASQWAIPLKWHSLGFNVIAVINFQNSPVRCKAVADAIWTKYLNSIPASSVTGITHFEIGNELDFSEYYTDTAAAYAHMLQLAYPILHAKGYIVICGNYLYSLNFYNELEALNAFEYCDAIGAHAYTGTVAGNIAIIDGVVAFGAKIGKTIICTEGGVRGSASNLPAWATLTQQYYTALQAIAGVILHFPCYTANPPEHPTDIVSILQIPEYNPTPYFNIAMTDALAVVAPVNKQLSGTPIGTAGSYENQGNTIAKVFDGTLNTFFDASVASGAWVGLDLGTIRTLTSIAYAPRDGGWSGYQQRMVGGIFEGSNDANFSAAVTLATVRTSPKPGLYTTVSVSGQFRYVRYVGPENANCNIAEMQVFGH